MAPSPPGLRRAAHGLASSPGDAPTHAATSESPARLPSGERASKYISSRTRSAGARRAPAPRSASSAHVRRSRHTPCSQKRPLPEGEEGLKPPGLSRRPRPPAARAAAAARPARGVPCRDAAAAMAPGESHASASAPGSPRRARARIAPRRAASGAAPAAAAAAGSSAAGRRSRREFSAATSPRWMSACPVRARRGGTRRVQLVRKKGRDVSG